MSGSNLEGIAKKIRRKYDLLFYFFGIFSGISFSLLGGVIDRWIYGEYLSPSYIKFGVATFIFSISSLYFLRTIWKDKSYLKDEIEERILWWQDRD